MKRFLQFWRVWRSMPSLPITDAPWSVEDDKVLENFMRHTPTGKRFLVALHVMAQDAQKRAVFDREHSEHACGKAAGWLIAVHYIEELSSKSKLAQPGQTQEGGDGEPSLLERYSP